MKITKKLFKVVLIGIFLAAPVLVVDQAMAEKKVTKKRKKTTDVSFEDLLIQGKYHFSDESVVTVEEDKVLDALLGVRKDFKDRIKKSASRY